MIQIPNIVVGISMNMIHNMVQERVQILILVEIDTKCHIMNLLMGIDIKMPTMMGVMDIHTPNMNTPLLIHTHINTNIHINIHIIPLHTINTPHIRSKMRVIPMVVPRYLDIILLLVIALLGINQNLMNIITNTVRIVIIKWFRVIPLLMVCMVDHRNHNHNNLIDLLVNIKMIHIMNMIIAVGNRPHHLLNKDISNPQIIHMVI